MAEPHVDAYARAIVEIAQAEDALAQVEDELLAVARAIEQHPELRERLTDIHLPIGQRLRILESELLRAAHPATRSALALLITSGRIRRAEAIARRVAELAAELRRRELAEVFVAVPLDDAQREQLRAALERATGKSLELKVFVDPSVIGGVRARIGDTVIDGSLARRLAQIRSRVE